MKIQYLGFLPLLIAVILSHYSFWKDYQKNYYRDGILAFNPIAFAILFIFYTIVVVAGAHWGVSK